MGSPLPSTRGSERGRPGCSPPRTLPATFPLIGASSVELREKRYAIARVVLHPAWQESWEQEDEDEDTIGNTVDLAVVELETPLEDVRPFTLYTGADKTGQELILLGAGQYDNGFDGARGSDQKLRRVTNIVDESDAYWLKCRFDAPPAGTLLEGVCGGGDSGGPALISAGLRASLSWGQLLAAPGRQASWPLRLTGHYARVSRYVEWIRETCDC